MVRDGSSSCLLSLYSRSVYPSTSLEKTVAGRGTERPGQSPQNNRHHHCQMQEQVQSLYTRRLQRPAYPEDHTPLPSGISALTVPASLAGLPSPIAMVHVGPPLSARGLNRRSPPLEEAIQRLDSVSRVSLPADLVLIPSEHRQEEIDIITRFCQSPSIDSLLARGARLSSRRF